MLVPVPVPSWGRAPSRRQRLLALLAVRDAARHLPGYLANVAPQVEGIVALDDASSDGTAELLADRPEVLEVVRPAVERLTYDEPANHRALVAAALRHGADWVISLDADERVEDSFRDRAERVIRRGAPLGLTAFNLPLCELWDSRSAYRVDGIWGRKLVARLFAVRPGDLFQEAPLHMSKAPRQARRLGGQLPRADIRIYHLHMVEEEDRRARRARYEQADPTARWQSIGYAYLTDERGLRLRRVSARRAFHDDPRMGPARA